MAQQLEGLLDGDVEAFAQESFGLFDVDAAGQCITQLLHHGRGRQRVLLQNRHAGDVGQGLADQEISVAECAAAGAEQAERAPNDAGGAHRDGVHGGEARVERGRDEPWPAVGFASRSATETG